MDCHSEKTTVDLCSELDCVNSTVKLEAPDGLKMHLPSHGMFKIHRIVFDRDMGRIEGTAKDALNSTRGTLSELKEEGKPMPKCTHCKTTISLPCWCCVDCTGENQVSSHSRDIMGPYCSVRQGRSSSAIAVNTSNSLSTTRTPRCIQS